jgi:hypothetical protein
MMTKQQMQQAARQKAMDRLQKAFDAMRRATPDDVLFTAAYLRMRSGQSEYHTRLFIRDRIAAGDLKNVGRLLGYNDSSTRRVQRKRKAPKSAAVHANGGVIKGDGNVSPAEARAARLAQLEAESSEPSTLSNGGAY